MATERLGWEAAVLSVTAVRSSVQPNDGFLMQLRVWEEMGCALDESHAFVKKQALDALSERQLAGEQIDREALANPKDSDASQVFILGQL